MEFTKPGSFVVGSTPILTAMNAKCSIDSGDQEIDTLILGMAGFSDGATKISVSGEFAIPSTGLEYDFPTTCATHTTIDVGYRTGGRTYQCRGRVLKADMSTDPNKPSTISVDFKGSILGFA